MGLKKATRDLWALPDWAFQVETGFAAGRAVASCADIVSDESVREQPF